jgi:hypothetical protein
MAKLSAHGTELFRYFSYRKRGLVSVRSDGVALIRYPGTNWKLCYKRKAGCSLEEWRTLWHRIYDKLAPWKKEITSLPTMAQIREWTFDSVCETTDGETCEPDSRGWGSHGPSWLVALGYL